VAYQPLWFEKVWNSTLGLPDQVFWRLLRVAKGQANLFGEKGLADKSLIPGLGAFIDDHAQDVSPEEVNEMFGKPFGDSTAAEIASSILFAPTSYMLSAVTASARVASKFGKVANGVGGGAKDLAGLTLKEGVDSLKASVAAADMELAKKSKMLGYLEDVARDGQTHGLLERSVRDIRKTVVERESVLALPFGIAASRLNIPVSVAHKGWISLLSSPVTHGSAKAIGALADRNIPWLSPVSRELRGLGKGWESGGGAKTVFRSTGEPAPLFRGRELEEVTAARGGVMEASQRIRQHQRTQKSVLGKRSLDPTAPHEDVRRSWGALSARHEAKGESAESSFRKLTTSISPAKTAKEAHALDGKLRGMWASKRKSLGLEQKPLTHENLREFVDEMEDAREADFFVFEQHNAKTLDAAPFDRRAYDEATEAFNAGRALRLGLRKAFTSHTGFKEMDDLARAKMRYERGNTAAQEQGVRLMSKAIRRIATNTGMTETQVLANVSYRAQMLSQTDEWEILGRALNGTADPEEFLRFAQRDLPKLVDRVADSARLLDEGSSGLAEGLRRGWRVDGIAAATPNVGSNAERLFVLSKQLKTMAREAKQTILEEGRVGTDFTPILDELTGVLPAFNQDVMRPFWELGGQDAKDYLAVLGQLNREKLRIGRNMGFVGESVPMAHQARVLSQGEAAAFKTFVGSLERSHPGVIAKLRSANPRAFDEATTETVDKLFEAVSRVGMRNADDRLMQSVERVLDAHPEMSYRFSVKPHVAALVDLGSKKADVGVAKTINSLLRVVDDAGQNLFEGGELLAHGTGHNITAARGAWRQSKRGGQFSVQAAERSIGMPEKWILVRSQKNGAERIIPLASTESPVGMSVQSLGAGKDMGTAAAHTVGMDGKLGQGVGQFTSGDALTQMIGTQVLAGEQGSLAAMARMFQDNRSALDTWLRTIYDPFHSLLKSAVTIVRPDFHLYNIASSFPMLHMQGLAYRHAFGGFKDATLFTSSDIKMENALGRLAMMEGETSGIVPGMRGIHAKAVTGRLEGAGFGRIDVEKPFVSGAGPVDIPQFLSDFADEGGFNTFSSGSVGTGRESRPLGRASEDLGRVRDNLMGLLKSGQFYDKAGKLLTKAGDALSSVGESSELFARFMGIFGFMRQGYTPRQAMKATMSALIDYNNFTPFFNRGVARAFSFAKFPAKNLVNTAKYANRSLGDLAASTKLLYNLPGSETDMGTLALSGGGLSGKLEDYRVNLQRALPQFDLLSSAAWIGDFFFDWRAVNANIEQVGQAPIRPAIPLSFLLPLGPGKERLSFGKLLREGFRTSYLTRWALTDRENPLRPQSTVMDKLASFVFGVRKPGQLIRKRWLAGQFGFVQRQIEYRIQEATSKEERDALVKELERLAGTTARLLRQ